MNRLIRRPLALIATLAIVVSGLVTAAPQAFAARGPQTDSVPTLYIDMVGTYYRTTMDNPPVTNTSPQGAFDAVNGSGSHTIAGGAKYELVDPANAAHNFVDNGTLNTETNVLEYGEIRGRGNYTWNTLPNLWQPGVAGWVSSMSGGTASFTQAQVNKRPYQMKLSAKHDMLGMGSAKTWILLANHADGSLSRNKVAMDLAAEFGLAFTPQARFIDLVVNGSYLGNYLLTEKVQEGGTRVDLKQKTGVLVELDNNYYNSEPSELVYTSPKGSHFVLKDAYKGDIYDANGKMLPDVAAGWADFKLKINWFESLLYAPNPDWSQIRLYLDVPSFIKFYFVEEFTENPEIAKSSIYFYKDGIDDVFHAGPVWDFDSSLGNYTDTTLGGNPDILYVRNIDKYRSGNNYFQMLFKMAGFENAAKQLYVEQLKLPVEESVGKLSQYQALAVASAAKNFSKYQILGRNKFFPPFTNKFSSTWGGEIDRVRSFMQRRVALLNSVYAPGAAANASDCQTTSTPAAITTAGAFNSLAPCRMLDTRTGNGGRGPVASGGVVALKVTGRGGVPTSGVSAVVLNVTVTNPTNGGWITAYPSGVPVPEASNLNFAPGQTVANQVTVKVGADGVVNLKNSPTGTTQLIADLAGFFVGGNATEAGSFTPVDPSRLLDTRVPTSTIKTVPANGTVDLQVGGAGGVPAGAGAVALNVTVTNPAANGYLSVYPTGAPPTKMVSNLNFVAKQTVPNAVTVKLGSNGKVTLVNGSSGTVDLIVDVNGYYKAGTATQSGMFVPLTPARILDSRDGTGMPKGDFKAGTPRMLNNYETIALKVTGAGGVATNAGAVVMNVTVANPTQAGYLTTFPDGTVRPAASSLNFNKWEVVPNLVTVKVGSSTGAVDIYNMTAGQTNVISDVAGYYIK